MNPNYHCARCGRAGHLPIDCPWPLVVRWLLAAVTCVLLGGLPL